ncbi:protein lin-52 homolog isoform X2 [Pyrgilauda ruficollis]|uniref:protein lin-52 homolog isoform X2 n=1 Tax=Pyrgilauda ruficollis TaxID=221976 RepID=UPI001B8819EF|nr:protein lin-52 homolog isoform X2 [Pyrgilauda ruficollis]
MAAPADGADLEASLLSFEKLDRASPDLWPEQLPGVAEFAASFKSPITSSPPKWMAELENDDIDMLKELGSLTTANLMEKVRGLQNLAYQLGLDEYPTSDPSYFQRLLFSSKLLIMYCAGPGRFLQHSMKKIY